MGGEEKQASASAGDGFGAYTGDPQLRDESTLGGFNGGFGSGDTTSTSAVYTQSLSAGENFVDPLSQRSKRIIIHLTQREKVQKRKNLP